MGDVRQCLEKTGWTSLPDKSIQGNEIDTVNSQGETGVYKFFHPMSWSEHFQETHNWVPAEREWSSRGWEKTLDWKPRLFQYFFVWATNKTFKMGAALALVSPKHHDYLDYKFFNIEALTSCSLLCCHRLSIHYFIDCVHPQPGTVPALRQD